MSTQEASSLSPTSSSASRWKFDVFLSFREVDTHKGFTSYLYAALQQKGISTFMDDENLERGKSILPELLKAIEESRVAIVIFSKSYASSTRCLDELAMIVRCMKDTGLTVFPVFYDVDPSDVRKQTGTFQESFLRHEERFKKNIEKVETWRAALREVANLFGCYLQNGFESKLIQQIVKEILHKLSSSFQSSIDSSRETLPLDDKNTPMKQTTVKQAATQLRPNPMSTHSASWGKLDVFLSFSCVDIGEGFTDNLYAALQQKGISTFKYNDKLERGKPSAPELFIAIEESRFAIIILSKNYASSTWCLDELAKIVRCMKDTRLMVYPVFYDVNPSDVRKQTGTFKESFVRHEERFKENIEKVETWKAALREVASLSGWYLQDGCESEVIQQIVEVISHQVSPRFQSITDDLVAIDSSWETLPLDEKKAPEVIQQIVTKILHKLSTSFQSIINDYVSSRETLLLDEKKALETLALDDKNASEVIQQIVSEIIQRRVKKISPTLISIFQSISDDLVAIQQIVKKISHKFSSSFQSITDDSVAIDSSRETLPLDEKKAPEVIQQIAKKISHKLSSSFQSIIDDLVSSRETLLLVEKNALETLPLDDKNAAQVIGQIEFEVILQIVKKISSSFRSISDDLVAIQQSITDDLVAIDSSWEILLLDDKMALVTLPLYNKNRLKKRRMVEHAATQLRPNPREILSLDDKPVKQTTVEQALPLRHIEILSLEEGKLKTLKKAKEFPTPKIQKVRDLMNFEEYYKPRLLSLGPIHLGKEKYQLGEQYKRSWAYDFIDRCGKTMNNFYKKIEGKIEELRDCYEEEVTENYDDKDLAWLLFVDGCAILRFIDCAINKGESKLGMINNSVDFVHRDLFLLENQLPYRLLKLLMSDNEKELRDSIKTYIQMHVMVPEGNPKEQRILRDEEPIHLLDLLRTALLGNPHEDSVIIRNRERDQHQISGRNVQELKAAGIHLRRSGNSCLRDISFSQSLNLLGHLYIPPITLNNLTGPMFLNLVAYEKCDNFKNDFGVTSYIAFLRSLIKEAKDVRELRKAGIFYNLVDSDEEVAKLFNEMPLIPTNIGVEEKMEEYYGTMLSLMFRIYHDNLNSTSRGIFKLLVLVLGLSGIKYTTRRYPFIHAYFTTYVLLWHFLSTSAYLIQRVLSS